MREHETIQVSKNEQQGPVPSCWRSGIAQIVDAFVRHDYALAAGVHGVAPVSADTATHIRDYIQDYGAALVSLPDETWASSVCIWNGVGWDVLVDLWTQEEGPSDLVLEVKVSQEHDGYMLQVYMVYVP